jgi:hypothetical protein
MQLEERGDPFWMMALDLLSMSRLVTTHAQGDVMHLQVRRAPTYLAPPAVLLVNSLSRRLVQKGPVRSNPNAGIFQSSLKWRVRLPMEMLLESGARFHKSSGHARSA